MNLPFESVARDILIRREASTSDKFGKKPEDRSVEELLSNGIIVLNKSRGPTSHQVSAYLQKILSIKKAGHSGTLDPNVTGVLPVALDKGTKVVQALLSAGKEYVCIMHLHKDVDEATIRKTCAEFVGKIRQLPPIKSAIKREWRYRKIYYLEILDIEGRDVLFKVGCQAGTYIRKLCTDIGDKIGGAHMAQLIRTKAGPLNTSHMVTLQDVADAFHYYKQENNEKPLRKFLLPVEKGVEHLGKVWVLDTTVDPICNGASLKVKGISKVESDIQEGDTVAIMTLKNELVALGEAVMLSKEMIAKEKGVAVKIQRVFIEPGVYPRYEK